MGLRFITITLESRGNLFLKVKHCIYIISKSKRLTERCGDSEQISNHDAIIVDHLHFTNRIKYRTKSLTE